MRTSDMTLAYVTKGFWYEAAEMTMPPEVGELELMGAVVQLANLVEQVRHEGTNIEFAGVWDYEVSEPFGEWLAEMLREKRELPSTEACLAWLRLAVELNNVG